MACSLTFSEPRHWTERVYGSPSTIHITAVALLPTRSGQTCRERAQTLSELKLKLKILSGAQLNSPISTAT
ncbi:hypothetical protein OUZ56_010098 [Daphnia magna]|uniref:Uncharacterized protein n=1 Tax=Daphnia magna TaxID=35525 RepID=A0ABR0AHT7_9CRUS|nr:hypothetical protein OUZ56_010098 [Daphnia magna]